MMSGRVSGALASILGSCENLVRLNLSWNDLRTDLKTDLINQKRGDCSCPFTSAALWRPGRLVGLELSFNGLSDAFGVRVSPCLSYLLCAMASGLVRLGLAVGFGSKIARHEVCKSHDSGQVKDCFHRIRIQCHG